MTLSLPGIDPHRIALSINETHRALGISIDTLYRWLERGTVASFKVDGRRLIPISELERLLTPTEPPSRALTHTEAQAADCLDTRDTTT